MPRTSVWTTALATALALSTASCRTPRTAQVDPPPQATAPRTTDVADVADSADEWESTQPERMSPGAVRQAVVHDDRVYQQIQPLVHEAMSASDTTHVDPAAAAVTQYPSEPRVPVGPPPHPDEYLYDGGDRGHPFHYEGFRHSGLETEDTVAEFVDHEGERHVKPSNQAAVYAPRFGSVRTISQPVVDYSFDKLAGTHLGVATAGMQHEQRLDLEEQTDQLQGLRRWERPGGVDSDATDGGVHQVAKHDQHLKIQNVYEDRSFLTEGGVEQTDEAQQNYGLDIAGVWTRDQQPRAYALDEFGHEVLDARQAREYSVSEDRRTPGDLHITKTADVETAHPGDLVTFTIRFENVGQRALTKVRILDHLTTRLQYVRNSAVAESQGEVLDGELTLEAQSDGSEVLVFELAAPLSGGAGGEITFQCRVR